jgi:putative phosphoribosyl transferase
MAQPQRFKNRLQAGKLLAQRLRAYAGRGDVIVLALPRGGVPVGFAVARALDVDLDILLVRKLGMPGHEEYAMGAVGSGGLRLLQAGLADLGVGPAAIEAATEQAMRELERRERLYRGARPAPLLHQRTVVLVDDGLATGATMFTAVSLARQQDPARIVVAVPVGAPDTCAALAAEVDELVCLNTPASFRAVGQWYLHFDQTSDEEVQDLLALAWREHLPAPRAPPSNLTSKERS